MKPIYEPKGAAKEYGDYAINIYAGCPHRCYYCFAPSVLHKDREEFHSNVEPRKGIVEAVAKQIKDEHITDKLVHLCFTCDPYPMGYDSMPTREIIKLLKDSGNHVQILTKAGLEPMRDFDLLDENDRYGITYAGYPSGTLFEPQKAEPCAGLVSDRLYALKKAKNAGIFAWVSCEPVLDDVSVLSFIECADYVDLWKIGKLNYHPSDIDWKLFGERVEATCRGAHRGYYIKDSLRKEMNKEAAI